MASNLSHGMKRVLSGIMALLIVAGGSGLYANVKGGGLFAGSMITASAATTYSSGTEIGYGCSLKFNHLRVGDIIQAGVTFKNPGYNDEYSPTTDNYYLLVDGDYKLYYTQTGGETYTTDHMYIVTDVTPSTTGIYYSRGHITLSSPKAEVTSAPVANTLTYTGSAQALVTSGTASNGTMKYKLGDGSWQDTVPTATSVGTYTVYYKAAGGTYGGTTYSDSSEGSVEVTISKASNPLTFSNQNVSKSFSTSAQTATLTGASNVQGAVTYSITSGNSSNYFSLNGTQLTIAANTPVGTYTLGIRATAAGNSNYNSGTKDSTVTVTIGRASFTPTVTMNGWTYGNTASTPSVSQNPGNGTVTYYYSTAEDGTYNTNKPTNAGTYWIYATIAQAGNYNSATTAKKSFTISKANLSDVTITGASGLTFDNTAKKLLTGAASVTGGGTIHYKVDNGSWTTDWNAVTAVSGGTHTVYYYADASSNYNAVASQSSPKNITVTIGKGTNSFTANPSAADLTYTGSDQTLLSSNPVAKYGTVEYSLNNSTWGTAVPKGNAAGNYTVYYRVPASTNQYDAISGQISVTIKQKAPNVTAPTLASDAVYNTEAHAVAEGGSVTNGTMYFIIAANTPSTSNLSEWSTFIPTKTDVGSYKVWYYVKGANNNYSNAGPQELGTFKITQAENGITAPAARSGLTYTSKAQSLVTKGSAAHGTLYYAVGDSALAADSSEWSTVIPKGTDAGTYKVWTMARDAAGNYETVISATPVEVTIAKKSISSATIVLDKTSVPDTATNPNVTVVIAGSLVVPADEYDSACTVDSDNIGTVTVTVKDSSENFTGSATTDYVVGTDIRDAVVTLDPETESYRAEQIRPHVTVVYEGEELIEGTDYRLEYGENTAVGMGAVTITGKGTYGGVINVPFSITARHIAQVIDEEIADQTFDGSAKAPVPTLTNGDETLTSGTDFTCYYSNNTQPGEASIYVVGEGNYRSSRTLTFNIIGMLNNSTFTSASVNKKMALNAQGAVTAESFSDGDINITFNGKKLTLGTDYTVASVDYNSETKTGTVTLEGMGYYAETVTVPFSAKNSTQALTVDEDIADDVTVDNLEAVENIYTLNVEQAYTITNSTGKILVLHGTNDVTIPVGGTYRLTVEDAVNYTLAAHAHQYEVSIPAASPEKLVIGCSGGDLEVLTLAEINTDATYSFGNVITPGVALTERYGKNAVLSSVKVYNSSNAEVAAADLTAGTVPVGTYTVVAVITYNGASYTLRKALTVAARDYETNSTEFTISAPALTFNGSSQTPTFTITRSGITLVEGTDYELGYMNGTDFVAFGSEGATDTLAKIDVGTYNVAVHFIGNYTGIANTSWTMNRLAISENEEDESVKLVVSEIGSYTYDGTAKTPEPTLTIGNVTLVKGTDYTLAYEDNTNAGTATVTISPVATSNYSFAEITKQFTINPKQVTPIIELGDEVLTYDGTAKTPTVTVKDGDVAIPDTEYTLSYENNTNAGTNTASVTVTDNENGNYTFEAVSENYSIQKASISPEAVIAPTAVDGLVYAPETSHELVNAGSVNDNIGTIWYRLGTDGTWSAEVPSGTNVATYTVYWYVKGDSNHNDLGSEAAPYGEAIVAAIGSADMTVNAEGYDGAYDGDAHGISVTAPEGATISYSLDGTDYSTDEILYTNFTDGAQTVYYKVEKANYNTVTDSATVNITKASMEVNAEDYVAAYDGDAHGISVTAPEDATISYSLDGTDYSTDEILYTDFTDGVQTVYYKVEKANYNTVTDSATVNITKKDVTVTPNVGQTKVYGAVDPTFTYTSDGLIGTDAIDGALSRVAGTDVSEYAFEIGTLDAGINYQVQLATGESVPKFVITAKPITDEDITLTVTLVGEAVPEITNVKDGETNLVEDTDYTVSTDESGNTVISGNGNYGGSMTLVTHTPATEPTYSANGNVEYWTYSGINYVMDAATNTLVAADDVTIPMLNDATSAITGTTLYDTVNKLNFTFTNTYTGTESASYGVLFYRDGELTNDMQVDDAGISNSPLTSGSGSFQIKDKGNGVYVRVYQKIGDQYVYSDQVYVKHSGL